MDSPKHYCMQLDFQAGKIRFLDSDRLDKAELGKAFPMTLAQTGPRTEFVVPVIHYSGHGGANTNLLIDTGCRIDGLTDRRATYQLAWARFLSLLGSGHLHSCAWHGEPYKNIKVAPVGRANVAEQKRQPRNGAANRRPAGSSDGSDNVSATLGADRAFPAAVAGR